MNLDIKKYLTLFASLTLLEILAEMIITNSKIKPVVLIGLRLSLVYATILPIIDFLRGL